MQVPERFIDKVLDSLYFEIFVYDKQGKIVYINKSTIPEEVRKNFLNSTEYDLASFYKYPLEIAQNRIETINHVFLTGERCQKEEEILTQDSKRFYLQTYVPILGENQNVDYVIRYALDISDKVLVQREFEYLANHDSLTGLPNRRLFYKKLEQALKIKQNISILLLDLDRFKLINDTLGHIFGDELIRLVAGRLLANIPQEKNLIVARLGGDEFGILILETNEEILHDFASRIVKIFREPFAIRDQELFITTSVGVYYFSTIQENISIDSVIHKADIAMYHSKESGRNQYTIYTFGMENKTENTFHIETKILQALRNKDFSVYFQPKISVQNCKISGAEALLRWEKESIPVVDFIRISEGSKLISLLGNVVIDESLKFLSKNKNFINKNFFIGINLSENQLFDEEFISSFVEKVKFYQVDFSQIELEIKEHIIMKNIDKSLEKICLLKDLGVKVSIDDYGSGSFSLSYLKNCPIDIINIDKSFIKNINENYQDAAITGAIISMAQKLNIKVSAEGVETKDQLLFLKYLRSDYMQGFIFSKPMPVLEFEKYLLNSPDYTNLFQE